MLLTRLGRLGRVFVGLLGIVVAAQVAVLAVSAPAYGVPAWQTVSYLGEQLRVPAAWKVQDLTTHPSTCVRLDVHVVYEGRIGPQPDCPARVVGGTEAIHLEPLADRAVPPGLGPASIGGQQAQVNTAAAQRVSHRIVAAFPHGGVLATISFGADASLAQQVLASFTLVSAAALRSLQASAPAAELLAAGPVTYVGKGFDACTAPSESAMNAWLASPYRAVGVYIGGLNRACDQPNLTATWVQDEIAAGWSLIPLYVGLQASCALDASVGEKIDHAQAAAQGAAAGNDAADQATALGMRSGSPVYFDMEAWNTNNSACNADVVTFIHAWTNALNAKGFRSGIYGSADAGITQVIAPLYGTSGWPGYVDFAEWDGNANTTSAFIPASAWPSPRRIKQYDGNVTETWGNVTINIDHDYSGGLVVGNQTPTLIGISPTTAAVGTPVTITGQGFVADKTTVQFGGTASGHVSVRSATQLTAYVPARAIATVDVTVSTAVGTSALSSADRFTYRPLNAMALDPATSGYWLTTPAGNVYNFNAPWNGANAPAAPVVGIAAAPGAGYWLTTGEGNVYNYKAPWYGSMAGKSLPAPVVGIAAAPGGGYWLVTSAGNVYNFNAPWYGSMAGKSLPAPVIGMATAPSGGYWLATSKGNVYNFGVSWYGSTATTTLTAPVTAIVSSNAGYLLATQSGDVFNYNAPYYGSPADRG